MMPDGLEQIFGGRRFTFAKKKKPAILRPPCGIKVGGQQRHVDCISPEDSAKSSQGCRRRAISNAVKIERIENRFVVLNSYRMLKKLTSFFPKTFLFFFILGLGAVILRGAEIDIRRDAVVEAVQKVMPSVVNIRTTTVVPAQDQFEQMMRQFFDPYHQGRPRAEYGFSLGSGIIIDEAGYILTNDHVVRRGVEIAVQIRTNIYNAKLVATSQSSEVALLKIEPKKGEIFQAVKFAKDDDLLLGETVIALGNPFGLGGSVSRGILSSRNRRPAAEKSPLGIEDWLQTDAAINPGNSGGPLVNLRGELIGLNVAVFREQNAQGIGFAIPIKRVAEALSEIFTPEESPQQLWFGARVRSNFNSLQVSSVQSGSPAEKAGLRVGDSILQIGEKTPRNFIEFVVELLNRSEKNSNVPLIVSRNGERKSLAVQLIAQKNFFNADLIRQKLGVTLQEVTPDLAQALRLNSTSGFLVAGVDDKSPAQIAGVRRGYLITAIDGRVPADLTDLAKILYEKKKGEKAQLGLVLTRQQGNLIQARPAAAEVKVR